MSMFDNYDSINPDIVPNNLDNNTPLEVISIKDNSIPRTLYDIKNRFIGYAWEYGDEFNFTLSVNDIIKVNANSIIYENFGEQPVISTPGYDGKKAYNILDNKSWTCRGLIGGMYKWETDKEVTYDANGTKEIEMFKNMTDKSILVQIYDRRWELVKSFENSGLNQITCRFDKDIYETIKSGIYYCIIKILGEDSCEIKSKFTIVIN